MAGSEYQDLLGAEVPPEAFVRRALSLMETDTRRRRCWRWGDWQKLEINRAPECLRLLLLCRRRTGESSMV